LQLDLEGERRLHNAGIGRRRHDHRARPPRGAAAQLEGGQMIGRQRSLLLGDKLKRPRRRRQSQHSDQAERDAPPSGPRCRHAWPTWPRYTAWPRHTLQDFHHLQPAGHGRPASQITWPGAPNKLAPSRLTFRQQDFQTHLPPGAHEIATNAPTGSRLRAIHVPHAPAALLVGSAHIGQIHEHAYNMPDAGFRMSGPCNGCQNHAQSGIRLYAQ